ncbi:MAG: PaaI family thioesterase [Rubrivivax sp.]|nr:PaaI family thioesterase [Rubrivivax sp.]
MTAEEGTAATLAIWEAEESAVRARGSVAPGVATSAQAAGRSGIELMRAQLTGELPRAPIGATLDFLLLEVEPGRALFQGRPGLAHLNPLGSVHGGWFATVLDSALGCCVHAALPAGKSYTTLELKANMIRALSPRVGLVRAEGRVIHLGGQTATADARLVGPDGKLYAHASTTCLVFPTPNPK